jgi:hypothetical protein
LAELKFVEAVEIDLRKNMLPGPDIAVVLAVEVVVESSKVASRPHSTLVEPPLRTRHG